jgi:putative phosphoesterase
MKTAIVLSDTHRNFSALEKLLPKMLENDFVFHLGDNEGDILSYKKELGAKIYSVKGNCDGGGEDYILEVEKVKILLTHGDRYGVKSSLYKLLLRAKELNVNAVFYGHTHLAQIEKIEGITFINPGCMTSYGQKSYCYAVFHDGKLTVKIVEV